jgi:hypothetical protein
VHVLQFTTALKTELLRMRQQAEDPTSVIRLTRNPDSMLTLTFDEPRTGDLLLDDLGVPPVVIAQELADQLDGAIVHFRDAADHRYGDSKLIVLPQRSGAVRQAWTPPRPPARSVMPRWLRVPHFGAANSQTSASQTAGGL